ncbi:hypothetical protein Y1Q_0014677 [Alligator mississippiensis]|uniref:Uncharacterized protein n=1 Tax=Alligator mississippiensis TaxID=8496 RepID=A0A151P909_ALLMI|nr:hypothetical protein Y1Q_0014677 [Alligator mississippiensis]
MHKLSLDLWLEPRASLAQWHQALGRSYRHGVDGGKSKHCQETKPPKKITESSWTNIRVVHCQLLDSSISHVIRAAIGHVRLLRCSEEGLNTEKYLGCGAHPSAMSSPVPSKAFKPTPEWHLLSGAVAQGLIQQDFHWARSSTSFIHLSIDLHCQETP